MIPLKAEVAWRGHSDCRACGIREFVLFGDLQEEDFKLIHTPIDDLEFPAGGVLFHQNDQARSVSTVRRGLIKLTRLLPDGTERIVRVLRAGDVAGLEALAADRYDTGAYALLPVAICKIPADVIRKLSTSSPRLHSRLMQKWTAQIREADDWIAELAHGSARQRVARLILKLREAPDTDEATLFARDEIAMMLGLTIETVSRVVAALTREQVLTRMDRAGRQYRIDAAALEQLAHAEN